MEEQKKKVTIDITNHKRTFINFQGNEIPREQALGGRGKVNISQPQVAGGETEGEGGTGGEEAKSETK